MTRTFLVALNLTDTSDMAGQANELHDDLETAGHDVVSVKPWGSPLDQLTPTPIVLPQVSPVEPAPPQT